MLKQRSFINRTFIHITLLFVVYNSASVILIPLFEFISSDFNVGDWFNGALIGGFFLFSLSFGLIWSFIADHFTLDRFKLLAILNTLSFAATISMFMARNEITFMASWFLFSALIGAVVPISHSLISDLFNPETRTRAFTIWLTIGGSGIAIGYAFAFIVPYLPTWRYTLIFLSLLSLIVSVPVALTERDVLRGLTELKNNPYLIYDKYPYRISRKDLRLVLTPHNKLIIYQGLLGSVPSGVIFTWAIHVLSRVGNMSLIASLAYMGLASTGSILGTSLSYVADRLHSIKPQYKVVLAGAASVLEGILFTYFFLTIPRFDILEGDLMGALIKILRLVRENTTYRVNFLIFFTALFFNSSVAPIKNSVLADINLPEHRATLHSAINIVERLAMALGITLVGWASYYVKNLALPVAISTILWIFSGMVWFKLARIYTKARKFIIYTLEERLNNKKSK